MAPLPAGPARPAVATATGLPPWALRPEIRTHLGRSLTLAVLAHAALVAALSLSVNWRTQQDTVFAAELWAAVPRVAAAPAPLPAPSPPPSPAPSPAPIPAPVPSPPPPAPAPPPAQLAVEAEKPKPPPKPAPKPPEPAPPPKPAPAPKPPVKEPVKPPPKPAPPDRAAEANERAQEAALAKQREENLKRMLGQIGGGGQGSSSSSTQPGADAAPSAAYAGRVRARIMPNVLVPQAVPPTAKVEVEVRLAGDGQVISRRVIKASGSPEWDATVLRAIDRTRVLPRDTDGRVPPVMILSFTPQD